jgi:hypothetical protein
MCKKQIWSQFFYILKLELEPILQCWGVGGLLRSCKGTTNSLEFLEIVIKYLTRTGKPLLTGAWPTDLLTYWPFDLLTFWPTDLLTYWSFDLLIFWPTDIWPTDIWPTDLLTYWPFDLLTFWPTDLLTYWPFEIYSGLVLDPLRSWHLKTIKVRLPFCYLYININS